VIGHIMFTRMIYFWNILGFEINNETINWIQRITNAKSKFILQHIWYCYAGNFHNQMNVAEKCSVYCCGVLYLLHCVMKRSLIQNVNICTWHIFIHQYSWIKFYQKLNRARSSWDILYTHTILHTPASKKRTAA
jgi:hypothetical protein